MDFYTELSRWYDEIFAVDAAEMRFTVSLLDGKRAVLDIGCGTGNKTIHLASPNRSVTGVDADDGMIRRAKEDNAFPGAAYEVLDMAALAGRFAPASFDGAVCLGNTLVHLPSPVAIEGLCRAVYALLEPGGVFVCQILNYARILDNAVTELPVIDTAHTRFSRFYERHGETLAFKTDLFLKDSGVTLHGETPLYPLRPEAFDQALATAGFMKREYYGSYSGAAFADDSFVLIASASK